MAIVLTNFSDGTLCQGCAWTVADEVELAKRIALVALGQSRHVAKILSGISAIPPITTASTRAAAIKLLTVRPGAESWHRDGWLFQTMSWLAASQANPSALIRAPHMILAHKGFDGLQLELDAGTGAVSAAVIFEDKATDNPRETIRDEVWPEFLLIEDAKGPEPRYKSRHDQDEQKRDLGLDFHRNRLRFASTVVVIS